MGAGLSPNGLILIALTAALALIYFIAPNPPGVLTFAFVAAGWVLSVALHEFGHAVTAYLFGDTTVVAKGYLSFDPARYTDPGTTLILPLIALALGGIGFPGGAVYIRNDLLRGPVARSLVSLAGPAMTALVLAVIGAILGGDGRWYDLPPALGQALAFLALLQGSALILNLLPVPGLDGFGAIAPFLPADVRRKLEPYAGLALVLLFLGLFFVPMVNAAFFAAVDGLIGALGVNPIRAMLGWAAFRFWG